MADRSAALSVVGPADAGPIARLEEVRQDESAPSVVFQRVCDGETLQQIARAWGVPKGPFVEWFTTEHSGLYDAALKARADELAHEALGDAQGATPETVSADRLRVDTKLRLAGKWDRKRYGEEADAVRVTPVTIQIANLRGEASVQVGAEQPEALPAGTI